MARLDVFKSPAGGGYVLDVQADILSHVRTRIVVPLVPADGRPPAAKDLNPLFDILDVPHVLVPQAMASVPAKTLGQRVASLAHAHDVILRALDVILLGY